MMTSSISRTISFVVGMLIVCPRVPAALPETVDAHRSAIGKPLSLEVLPRAITLDGPRAGQQLLVTGRYADGTLRDLTRHCHWEPATASMVDVTAEAYATARKDGRTRIEIRVGGLSAHVPVTIVNSAGRMPVSFRRELMPVLSAAGCSDIHCHGAPSGKNGFKLSLWGFDPNLDYRQLTHDMRGRRTNSLEPDRSLMMMKALMRVPHVGGVRFAPDSTFAEIVRDWQAEGLRDDPRTPKLKSLSVTPSKRVLRAPAQWQQLAVRATFDDGREADVTHLTAFSSSDMAIAEVSRTGLVEFKAQGEVAILCRFLGRMESVRLTHIAAPLPGYRWPNPPAHNYVDSHVFDKLKLLNIAPSPVCDDERFIRRVYLDLCGVLPTPKETREFLAATEPHKRSRLIDELLQRPEYADYWTKKWFDVLRVSRDSIQLAGAQNYHRWMRERVAGDVTLSTIVSELLTSQGRSFRDAAANYFCVSPMPRKETEPHAFQKDMAEATAQLFLGVRLQCAKCHNHPYERWTQDDYLSLAAFFAQVKRNRIGKAGPSGRPDRREISVALDFEAGPLTDSASGETYTPHFPGEPGLSIDAKQDHRRLLADWLVKPDNPFFAKAVVNRVWFHLHGRGIVEPVDDFRDSNPSANDALLNALAEDFVAHDFRLKPLIRTIVNSRTYQLSPATNDSNRGDDRYFSHRTPRPLPAEVLLDAICGVTGVPETFEITKDFLVGVPDGTVKMPKGTRAVQLPVSDIETLINTAGKYVRYESHPFLRTFGQPNGTQTCECDRDTRFGRKQALELIIGEMISSRLAQEDNRIGSLMAQGKTDREILNELSLRALARTPTERAAKAALRHVADSSNKRQGWEDVLWTILNSQEFVYQH